MSHASMSNNTAEGIDTAACGKQEAPAEKENPGALAPKKTRAPRVTPPPTEQDEIRAFLKSNGVSNYDALSAVWSRVGATWGAVNALLPSDWDRLVADPAWMKLVPLGVARLLVSEARSRMEERARQQASREQQNVMDALALMIAADEKKSSRPAAAKPAAASKRLAGAPENPAASTAVSSSSKKAKYDAGGGDAAACQKKSSVSSTSWSGHVASEIEKIKGDLLQRACTNADASHTALDNAACDSQQ